MMHWLRPWFAHPWALWLLLLLPVLGLLGLWSRRRRQRDLARFGNLVLLQSLLPPNNRRPGLRAFLRATGLLLLIVGIAGPRWGRDPNRPAALGRDLVCVLDVSRSMLAQDVLPSRQERAKQAFADLSYTLQQRGGHRLALVAFAGRAKIVCPLTHDYDHFREALDKLDAATPPPELRPAGPDAPSGTRMGEGLRAAIEAHDPRFRGFQDILIISDGDDPARDDEWQSGVEAVLAAGIPVHTVGVGDPDRDSVIPVKSNEVLRHQKEVVLTRLHEAPLEQIARRTHGTYTPARTQALPLGELFRDRLERRGLRDADEDALPVYQQRYAWFLGPALLLLAAEMLLGRGKKPKADDAA